MRAPFVLGLAGPLLETGLASLALLPRPAFEPVADPAHEYLDRAVRPASRAGAPSGAWMW